MDASSRSGEAECVGWRLLCRADNGPQNSDHLDQELILQWSLEPKWDARRTRWPGGSARAVVDLPSCSRGICLLWQVGNDPRGCSSTIVAWSRCPNWMDMEDEQARCNCMCGKPQWPRTGIGGCYSRRWTRRRSRRGTEQSTRWRGGTLRFVAAWRRQVRCEGGGLDLGDWPSYERRVLLFMDMIMINLLSSNKGK